MSDQELMEVRSRLQRQHGITTDEPGQDAADVVAGMINMVAAVADRNAETDSEYMGEDGLMRCRVCGGPRQTIITPPFEGAKPRVVRCWCKCPTAQDIAREREKQVIMEQRRSVCFQGTEDLRECTFDRDDGTQNKDIVQAARQYAAEFPQHLKDGMGLLFYGPIGTGKTFLAACIANAVLDRGYKVKMTNFATVADEMWSVSDKAAYISDLCKYPLLILDDLGVERKSEYMQEMVYKIVNARYVAGAPVIVTTNLTPDELSKAESLGYSRTYDRLLEKCLPIKVDGRSRRRAAAVATWTDMRRKLGLGGA